MTKHEITEWMEDLDRAHALVRAGQAARSAGADSVTREALEVLANLHERMLRAEVRAVMSRSSAARKA